MVGLARARASIGATIAYWLGNPVLNPATIVFMGLVLGWRWAGLRILIGLPLVFGVATAVEHFFGRKVSVSKDVRPALEAEAAEAVGTAQPVGYGSGATIFVRWLRTAAKLVITLIPEFAIVVLGLGAARAFLFPSLTHNIGGAAWLVVVLAITGTLFVIPTAGEIPIIAVLLGFGLSAASAGALMITLPAVSLPSLVMVGRAVPAKVLAFVGGSVVVAGLVTAGLAAAFGF